MLNISKASSNTASVTFRLPSRMAERSARSIADSRFARLIPVERMAMFSIAGLETTNALLPEVILVI